MGPVAGGLFLLPFIPLLSLPPLHACLVSDGQVKGAHPHSLSPLKNGCTFVMGSPDGVSGGGGEQTQVPMIALLLPRA